MIDHPELLNLDKINTLSPEIKRFLKETRDKLKGSERRKFMAKVVRLMGKGGQRRAERELGWDRKVIIKGTKELGAYGRHIDKKLSIFFCRCSLCDCFPYKLPRRGHFFQMKSWKKCRLWLRLYR